MWCNRALVNFWCGDDNNIDDDPPPTYATPTPSLQATHNVDCTTLTLFWLTLAHYDPVVFYMT